MIPQERKFTLAEVHTKLGTMGELRFDQTFMQVLGVKPGDSIAFSIDPEGVVTVKGRAHEHLPSPQSTQRGTPQPGEVTQPALFTDAPTLPTTRRTRKQ